MVPEGLRRRLIDPQERLWIYNGLDVLITREVLDTLRAEETDKSRRIYGFERRAQGPAMTMQLRGTRIDPIAKTRGIKKLRAKIRTASKGINAHVADTWRAFELVKGWCKVPHEDGRRRRHKWPRGVADDPAIERNCELCGQARWKDKPYNPLSHPATTKLLYEDMGLKRQYNRDGRLSADKDCLDRLARAYPDHAPLFDGIEQTRGLNKQRNVLEKRLSPDGRWRSSFNVAATKDARWSSSKNCFGDGDNMQNVTREIRDIFIADPGMGMVYADLEQAESKGVAYLSGDEAYIEAHEKHNVHVYCGREVFWPEGMVGGPEWTGDDDADKLAMKTTYVPWDPSQIKTYYDQSKRNQHGSNYYMTPYGLAFNNKMPVREAEETMARYFGHFGHISAWHNDCERRLRETKTMENPLGRERQFFEREWEKDTLRQYIASGPQSMVADLLNTALILIWEECDPYTLQLLQQGHDAVLTQFPLSNREGVDRLEELMSVPVDVTDIYGTVREMTIGVEVATGTNWGECS